jgi:hypothetical protein
MVRAGVASRAKNPSGTLKKNRPIMPPAMPNGTAANTIRGFVRLLNWSTRAR